MEIPFMIYISRKARHYFEPRACSLLGLARVAREPDIDRP